MHEPEHVIRAASGSGKTEVLVRSAVELLALQRLTGVGPRTALRIALDPSAIDSPKVMEMLTTNWDALVEQAHDDLQRHEQQGILALSFFDEQYPARLRAIHDPPPVLFVHGSIDAINAESAAAVVGTRAPTKFGCSATEELTATVAGMGWTVISGLAHGIDTLAHGAALKYKTRTVAVMAGGLDSIYPAENRELAAAIVDQGGALVSEQPLGTRPRAAQFVARNRIQTALSAAVVVIQTALKGGTTHTARHAAAQGRPIFCPKPHTRHEKNEGVRALLDQPARELCAVFPSWRDSASLCSRLGDRPLAHAVVKDHLDDFIDALELCLEDPQTMPEQQWWPLQSRRAGHASPDAVEEPHTLFAFAEVD